MDFLVRSPSLHMNTKCNRLSKFAWELCAPFPCLSGNPRHCSWPWPSSLSPSGWKDHHQLTSLACDDSPPHTHTQIWQSLGHKITALQARCTAGPRLCSAALLHHSSVVLGGAENVARTELFVLMLLQCGLAVARRVVERSLAALGRAAAGRGRTSSSLTTHHHHYYSLPSHPARARRQPSLDLKWKYGNCEREVERLNTDLDKLLPRRFLNWLEIFFQ